RLRLLFRFLENILHRKTPHSAQISSIPRRFFNETTLSVNVDRLRPAGAGTVRPGFAPSLVHGVRELVWALAKPSCNPVQARVADEGGLRGSVQLPSILSLLLQ